MRLPIGGSRLGRTLIALNLLGLAVIIVGSLALNEFRRGLIEARVDSLTTQGAFIANVLVRAATSGDPAPTLDPSLAADTLQLLFIPKSQRARLFDRNGQIVADSYVLSDKIEERPLPPARRPGQPPPMIRRGPNPEAVARAEAALKAEVRRAALGSPVAEVRRGASGARVVSVSMPIQHVQAVLGVLTLEAGDVDQIVAKQRAALVPFIVISVFVTLVSSWLLNAMVARPIMRLARAADQVRLSRGRALSLPDVAARRDEVGDLARSLDAMTTTLTTRMDAIEHFAADVSHEIKNPLTSLRSAVETLEMDPPEPGRTRLLGILKHDVGRLDRLITDISSASRLDAELSRDAPRSVDLGRLLADLASVSPGRDGVRTVLLAPEVGEPVRVAGREGPLGQVFRNLIDNARSFSSPGGEVRVTLRRGRGPTSREVEVAVEDEGPGIPPDSLERIFERFYTARPKGQPGGGGGFGGHSGLGLSIVRQIVEAHGGRVRAENRADPSGRVHGARFVVTLPEQPG